MEKVEEILGTLSIPDATWQGMPRSRSSHAVTPSFGSKNERAAAGARKNRVGKRRP